MEFLKGVITLNEKFRMIHNRNVLICKLIWICIIIGVVVNAIVDIKFLKSFFPFPAAFLFSSILTGLVLKEKWVKQTMYLIIFTVFSYFTVFTICQPNIYNFSFIWFGLVVSSVYQDGYIIIASGVSTVLYINYFFSANYQEIFPRADHFTPIWLSVTAVFITVFLFFVSRFSEGLRLKAEKSESGALNRLKTTQEFLDTFISNMVDATCVFELNGEVSRINKAFEKMYGWTEEEFVCNSRVIIPNKQVLAELESNWLKVINGEQIKGWETIRKNRIGTILNINVTMFPIYDGNGDVFALVSMARDITERKRTDEFLRESDKLNAIGQLAAGVAHEIRNPLTTVIGFVQLLQRRKSKDDDYYEIILSELERINFITNEFLVLSKPQEVIYQVKNIVLIINDVVTLLNTRAIISNVEIATDFTDDEMNVKCDANKLKQVFINIIKNGIESMPEGGKLLIIGHKGNDHTVKLKIIDQGCGIPEDQIKRLGEPFFSTKEDGNGLGIVVSKKIIHNHRGTMNINSQVTNGTCVEIILQLVNGSDDEAIGQACL
jgi:PAS domain S-box-containing protein